VAGPCCEGTESATTGEEEGRFGLHPVVSDLSQRSPRGEMLSCLVWASVPTRADAASRHGVSYVVGSLESPTRATTRHHDRASLTTIGRQMYTHPRLLHCAAAFLLILSGCASSYDSGLIERRTRQLYDSAQAPAPEGDSHETASARSELLEQSNLEQYVAIGLRHSAQLRAAFETWLASTERVEQVSSLPDPKLSYAEFIEQVQTRTGSQNRRIGLSQAFPWPGELSTKAKLATRMSEAAWERVEQTRLAVTRHIEEAFHEYAFLARELAITQELLQLVKGFEPVVQGRIRAGAGQDGLLRLQVEIGRLEDDLASMQRRRPALSSRLADAMNLPLEAAASLPWPELEVPELVPLLSAAELIELALDASPKLRVLTRQLEAARISEELAAYKRRPDFAARVDYIQTGEALNPSTPGSGDDPLFLGLSMSLPVWRSSYSAASREARHSVRAANARLDDARSTLNADITSEAYRVDDAQRRIKLYRESLIPRARESLQLTTGSYRAGGASVLELLDSERTLLDFELSHWRACSAYLKGDARLKELLGGAVQ
jgi:cobalt-zinc-cadmium efflux system outer membrane protein